MGKINQNPKIGQIWRPVALQSYVVQKVDRPRKLPGPWTTTRSKQYLSAVHPLRYNLLWVRCLFDPLKVWSFGGKWPMNGNFSIIFVQNLHFITDSRVRAKFGENRPLWSCRKVVWYCLQKTRRTRPIPPFCPIGWKLLRRLNCGCFTDQAVRLWHVQPFHVLMTRPLIRIFLTLLACWLKFLAEAGYFSLAE